MNPFGKELCLDHLIVDSNQFILSPIKYMGWDYMNPIDNHIHYSPDGISAVDAYILSPGIMLSYNQIYQNTWETFGEPYEDYQSLSVNICLDGRCDVSLGAGKYTIVTKNHAAISTLRPDRDFYYPGNLYEGIAINFDMGVLSKSADNFLSFLGISLEAFKDYFCRKNGICYQDAGNKVMDLADQIWILKSDMDIGKVRYLLVRLLYELLELPAESTVTTFFTKGQLSIVKKAERLIMEDLSVKHPAKEFAEMFGISESSFKLYFKSVFGMTYMEYFRHIRMKKAAELLENTTLKVAEISLAVGYENQGKFARAFQDEYGAAPLEFRRLSK